MLLITSLSLLPNKKVIVDVASRNGCSLSRSCMPQDGIATTFRSYISPALLVTTPITQLLSKQSDFDADRTKPKVCRDEGVAVTQEDLVDDSGIDYNPAVHKVLHESYYRRLEDIPDEYIHKYTNNVAFNLVHRDKDGLREYNASNRLQPCLTNEPDDSDITELSELLTLTPVKEFSSEQCVEASTRMPYVMKRLHSLSCLCGIHMLSFIAAYQKAIKKINLGVMLRTTTTSVKKNRVIEAGVYKCSPNGYVGGKIEVAAKNKNAEKMFYWIIGESDEYSSYYQDYKDFVKYAEILHLDILNDDMTKYDADFMNNLVVTTVTPNKQYNKIVADALRLNSTTPIPKDEEVDELQLSIHNFNELLNTNSDMIKYTKEFNSILADEVMEEVKALMRVYQVRNGHSLLDARLYSWRDGFLHYNGHLVKLNSSFLANTNLGYPTYAIIHELGYCIMVTDLPYVLLTHTHIAINNINYVVNEPESVTHWEEVLLQ